MYPLVARLLGYRKSFRLGLIVFAIGCVLLPMANHISGPIGNNQSDNSNSTTGLNTTTWSFTNDNNVVTMVDTLHGTKYQSKNSDLNSVNYYGLDNNSTNNSCWSSRLGSSVGQNSVKRIPARVWLTLSWILATCIIGRFV